MRIATFILAAGGIAVVGAVANADGSPSRSLASPALSSVPRSALFVGVGGSDNSVNFNDHKIYAQGVSNVYLNGVLVAFGSAGGPADPYFDTQFTFAPSAQIGLFRHFAESKWLWGAKFTYNHLGATSTNQNVIIPQVGSFTSANSDSFTGNVVVRSYQSCINHQMTLMPFVGRSFEKSFVYFGAGPSLSQAEFKLNGVIGFADINGMRTNITGTPSNFSSAPWVFGGAAVVGATYFLDPSWFLDLSYTYLVTRNQTSEFSGPFASSTSGYIDTGILSGTYSGRWITQAFTISINKAF